jgi:predicted dinucleotide-binding enzyme
MNITVLGCGNIGSSIGGQWVRAGHNVTFGVRNTFDPEVQARVRSLGPAASVASTGEAVARGEVVLFAIPGGAMDETIAAQAQALDGKIIIDAANKIGQKPGHSLPTFAERTPAARVYRAFNTLGWENFADPHYGDQQADLFFCGPAGEARSVVQGLIADVGLRPVYVGGADQADVVDGLLRLWMALVRGQGLGRGVAFKMLRR